MTILVQTEVLEIPQDLLADPLEWFFAEHYRHRQFCRLVEEAAQQVEFDQPVLEFMLKFMQHELALHIIDEEEDLFPLLVRRAQSEDDVDTVIGLLSAEHRADIALAAKLTEHLASCLATQTAPALDRSARKSMEEFARQELMHLALENAVVLPIARLRLTADDLEMMSRRLAARRGIILHPAKG